jgi:hypothetical protein
MIQSEKKLGIWLDHSNAHLMELINNSISTTTVESTFSHAKKNETMEKSEQLMHNKEQHEQLAYYKVLEEIILSYTNVILFGPTDAKTELYNLIKNNRQFENIKIATLPADKMTENQQHAFVKEYFETLDKDLYNSHYLTN